MNGDAPIGLAACLAGLAALGLACGSRVDAAAGRLEGRVLIVGVDGFEWKVALPLLRAGRMPNLEALMRRGSYGVLETFAPVRSPVLWTTVATGKVPRKHGIHDFVKPASPADGGGEGGDPGGLYTNLDRRAKAFWNILSDHGVSSDTIGWWLTWPVEPVAGLMVAQTSTKSYERGLAKGTLEAGLPYQVWPPGRTAEMLEILDRNDRTLDEITRELFGDVDVAPEDEERWNGCLWAFRADRTYLEIAERRLRSDEPSSVTSVYLGGTDVVGHRFWAAHDPEPFGLAPDSPEVRTFGHVIDSYYVFVDRALGRLIELAGEDATVLVVSDHGMGHKENLTAAHRTPAALRSTTGHHGRKQHGVFVAAGPSIVAQAPQLAPGDLSASDLRPLGRLQDFCPTLLALLGLPLGADMDGQPLLDLFEEPEPPTFVGTHDDEDWLAERAQARRSMDLERDETERLEQLGDLGYLDGARGD